MINPDILLESYPIIQKLLEDIKTKTMYGKFSKMGFYIHVPKTEDGNLVTFNFIIKLDLLIDDEVVTHKKQYSMAHTLEELENTELQSDIVNHFDSMVTESFRQLTSKYEFDSMRISVYNNGPVGDFKYLDIED